VRGGVVMVMVLGVRAVVETEFGGVRGGVVKAIHNSPNPNHCSSM